MLLVSDDFILDLESMNHKLTNTMLWPSKYISQHVKYTEDG